MNPNGKDGKPFLCSACGSFRHFMRDCPDSHDKVKGKNVLVTEEISESDIQEAEVERFVLYTTDTEEICRFTTEAMNCAALDTCCTTTVAGWGWIK